MEVPSLLNRLSSMVEKRFGCALSFSPVEYLRQSQKSEMLDLISRNRGAEMIIAKNDLVLPLEVESHLMGVAVINGGGRLLPSDMEQVRQLVDLILGSYLIGQARLQSLRSLEDHLRDQLRRRDQSAGNVTWLADLDSPSLEEGEMALSERISELLAYSSVSPENHSPILIEGHSRSGLSEMALEVHRQSGRSAFVRYWDFQPEDRSSVEELKTLGPITLYIDELERLSMGERDCIIRSLSGYSGAPHFPRFVFGVVGSAEALVERGDLNEEIWNFLKLNRLRMDEADIQTGRVEQVAKLIQFAPRPRDLN